MQERILKGLKKLQLILQRNKSIWKKCHRKKQPINDLFTWVMFNKDSKGVEKFNLRPLDKNGVQIDFRFTELLMERNFHRKKTKTKGLQNGTATQMQGNVNEFKWNEPVAEKGIKKKSLLEKIYLNKPRNLSKASQRELMKFARTKIQIQKLIKNLSFWFGKPTADGLLAIAKDTIAKLKKRKSRNSNPH